MYELIKATHGDDSISEYKGIYQAAVIGLQQESLTKNLSRIQDDFYFSNFHPINDYNLQVYTAYLPSRQRIKFVNIDDIPIHHFVIFIDDLLRITAFDWYKL